MREEVDIVVEWDVDNGGEKGALIVCQRCWGQGCEWCSQVGRLHRPYHLPEPVTATEGSAP